MLRIKPKTSREYPLWIRIIFFFQKKKYGAVLEPMLLWGRTPQVMKSFLAMFRAFNRKNSPLDPQLRALICTKISQVNECAFCVDMNSAFLLRHGGEDKLTDLKDFQLSSKFDQKEKMALKYAEVITRSDLKVDEPLFLELKKYFSDDAIVELTALIAFQNMSSKFNAALGATAFGFCQISKGKDFL